MLTALQAPDEALDPHEKKFVAAIREHGWFGTNVFAEGGQPNFTYTTGFWVTSETAHSVFWGIFRELKTGITPPMLTRSSDLLGNHDAYLFPVQKVQYREYLGWSRWFYAGDEFPCSQLVWPDRDGRFPWEPTFDQEMADRQVDIADGSWATRKD
jgi:hypothetical protein